MPPYPTISVNMTLSDFYIQGLRCNGQEEICCTKENPCELGEGDCDYDYDCAGSLICGKDGGGRGANCPWGNNDECCREPGRAYSAPQKSDV